MADFVSQTLDTVAGETYHYSYWLLGGSQQAGDPSAFHATLGGDSIGAFINAGPFDYLHVFGDYVATSGQTEITFEGFNKLGIYFLDDVSVTGPLAGEIDAPGGGTFPGGGVPEPATWAMMLLGFLGIGATLRRRTAGRLAVAA